MPRDKLMKRVTQLAGLRELLDSKDPEGILIGYRAVLDLNPAITPAMVEKLLSNRCGLKDLRGCVWLFLGEISVSCGRLSSASLMVLGVSVWVLRFQVAMSPAH